MDYRIEVSKRVWSNTWAILKPRDVWAVAKALIAPIVVFSVALLLAPDELMLAGIKYQKAHVAAVGTLSAFFGYALFVCAVQRWLIVPGQLWTEANMQMAATTAERRTVIDEVLAENKSLATAIQARMDEHAAAATKTRADVVATFELLHLTQAMFRLRDARTNLIEAQTRNAAWIGRLSSEQNGYASSLQQVVDEFKRSEVLAYSVPISESGFQADFWVLDGHVGELDETVPDLLKRLPEDQRATIKRAFWRVEILIRRHDELIAAVEGGARERLKRLPNGGRITLASVTAPTGVYYSRVKLLG